MTDDTTLLVLSGMDVPPYSARGLSQTLEPIGAAAQLQRTINGNLIDTSASQFRKFKSTISCSDQQTPAVNNIWPGALLVVDCVAELSYKTSGGSPSRSVVTGSSRVEGDFTFYRPQLTMRVMNYNTKHDEYDAVCGWSLELEEV